MSFFSRRQGKAKPLDSRLQTSRMTEEKVMLAHARIRSLCFFFLCEAERHWIPAFAGMTEREQDCQCSLIFPISHDPRKLIAYFFIP